MAPPCVFCPAAVYDTVCPPKAFDHQPVAYTFHDIAFHHAAVRKDIMAIMKQPEVSLEQWSVQQKLGLRFLTHLPSLPHQPVRRWLGGTGPPQTGVARLRNLRQGDKDRWIIGRRHEIRGRGR